MNTSEDYFEFRCWKNAQLKNPKVYLTNGFVWANEGYAAKFTMDDSFTQHTNKARSGQNCDPFCLEDFNIYYSLGKKNRWKIISKFRDTVKFQDDLENCRVSCYVIERDSLFGHLWAVADKNLLDLEISPNNSNIIEFISIMGDEIEYKCNQKNTPALVSGSSYKTAHNTRTVKHNKDKIHVQYLIVNFTNSKNLQNSTMWRRTDYAFRNYKRKKRMLQIRQFMDPIREYYSECNNCLSDLENIGSDTDENPAENKGIPSSFCLGDFILSPINATKATTVNCVNID